MTYRYFPDRTLVMVCWKQWIENGGLETVNWKQRAGNDKLEKAGKKRQGTVLQLLRGGDTGPAPVSFSLFLLSLFLFYFVFFRLFL